MRIETYSPDMVRNIRKKMQLSQAQFATKYKISVRTLQAWEQGWPMSATSRAFLNLVGESIS